MTDTAITPSPLNTAFFKQLLRLGDDMFLNAVVREAVRGNIDAMTEALAALNHDARINLLWARPEEIAIPEVNDEFAGGIWMHKLPRVSLIDAILTAIVAEPIDKVKPTDESVIDKVSDLLCRRWSEAASERFSWHDKASALFELIYQVCLRQPEQGEKDLQHPLTRLLDAAVRCLPVNGPILQLAAQTPLRIFTQEENEEWRSDLLITLLTQGQTKVATRILERVGAQNHVAVESFLGRLGGVNCNDAMKQMFSGFLFPAIVNSPRRAADAGDVQPLDSEQNDVLDLIKTVNSVSPGMTGDVITTALIMVVDIADQDNLHWDRTFVKALVAYGDDIFGIDDQGHWTDPDLSIDRLTNQPGWRNNPKKELCLKALQYRIAPLLAKFPADYLMKVGLRDISLAWKNYRVSECIDVEMFRQTMQCLQNAGVDFTQLIQYKDSNFKDVATTPLHEIASTGHPQMIEMMMVCLEFGCDPRQQSSRKWEAKSHLPPEQRKQWMHMVKSMEVRAQALSVIEEFSAPPATHLR